MLETPPVTGPAFTDQPRKSMDWETFFLKYRDPDFVPGFTILNKLGSGVFGDVYKARRTSIGKIYAIKFLRIQDEHLQEQVLRELGSVENFAHVDHPNLVSIEDRGEVCGIPFIVMGYAGDETLKTLLGDGPLEPSRVVRLMRQILRGVEALHTHGIVHFDLKPANVFIKGDAARVGDYGLSRIMTESRATLSMGRGTPYYMAPEMLQRKGDARSDVYSLGVMLFEMLVGDVPFKGGTEWEILRRHEKESPVIPEEVPPGFREVLERSLQKNPERRFADAGEMLRALPEAPASGDSDPGARTLSFASSDRASSAGARAGRMVGRAVAQLPLSLARVREEVGDLLQQVRRSTGEMVAAARDEFDACKGQGLEAEHRAWWNPGAAARRAAHEARRARHMARGFTRPAGALFRGVGMLASGIWGMVAWPLFLAGWLAHNLVQVVVVLVIIAALCAGVHLGLEAAIL